MSTPDPVPSQPATLQEGIATRIEWLDEEIRQTTAATMSDDEQTCIINRAAGNVLHEWRSHLTRLLASLPDGQGDVPVHREPEEARAEKCPTCRDDNQKGGWGIIAHGPSAGCPVRCPDPWHLHTPEGEGR